MGVKQAIVVRKDLKVRKGKLACMAVQASMKFITDNNESKRGDELQVKLSQQEAEWFGNPFALEIVTVDSQDALENLGMRAELQGVNVYYVFEEKAKENDEPANMLCAAFGPDDEDQITQLIGSLKPL